MNITQDFLNVKEELTPETLVGRLLREKVCEVNYVQGLIDLNTLIQEAINNHTKNN